MLGDTVELGGQAAEVSEPHRTMLAGTTTNMRAPAPAAWRDEHCLRERAFTRAPSCQRRRCRSHEGRTQMRNAAKRGGARYAKTASLCGSRMNRPPPHDHGKEGIDGSSPSEGFAEAPA